MKAIGWFFALVLTLAPLANAAQVAISNNAPPFPVGDALGDAIPGGAGFVVIGSFSIDDTDILAAYGAADIATIDAAFTQFGASIDFATPSANSLPGFFSADVASPILAGSPLIGQNIYLITGEGTGIADSTGFAVVRWDTAFEQDNPAFGTSVVLSDAQIVVGRVDPIRVPLGNDVLTVDGLCTGGFACIPEPGSAALTGLAAGLLILRRRR